MTKENRQAIAYLKNVYGLDMSDLDIDENEITIEEVDRIAEKFDFIKLENWTIEKAQKEIRRFIK